MNGASGSGCVAVGPPAMISGAASPRSAAAQRDAATDPATFEHVRVRQLVLQREPDDVELRERRRRLQRQQRQTARAQLGLAVQPGRERALAGDVVGCGSGRRTGSSSPGATSRSRTRRGTPGRRAPRRSPPACAPAGTRRRRSATASRPWPESPRMGAACRQRPRARRTRYSFPWNTSGNSVPYSSDACGNTQRCTTSLMQGSSST